MNRIILAYAPENTALAESIDRQLSRIGIPFEHAKGAIAAQIESIEEPVLLLVTDNLLTNQTCLQGLLPVLQQLQANKRLVPVVADGIDSNGQAVPTHIDRMANALHYMKFWQDAWLALSDRYQQADGKEKSDALLQLDETRGVANEIGEIIGLLREAGYVSWEQFQANDFEQFFQKFELSDWHAQYKRLEAQSPEHLAPVDSPHLPELHLSGGLLTPEPIAELEPEILPAEPAPQAPPFVAMEQLADAIEQESAQPVADEPVQQPAALTPEEQAARDAWFWIEKGHLDRGLDLFRMAMEQYPHSTWLQSEYDRALSTPASAQSNQSTQSNQSNQPNQPNQSDEAKSYELMGDMAVDRGDYLFAKYCWDRVAEIAPAYPNIYRKLGLMTAEHLRDYRETAAIYLRKALESNPKDQEVLLALGDINETVETLVPPGHSEAQAPAPEDTKTRDSRVQFEAVAPEEPSDLPEKKTPALVLITGATSGIGRATAEIFAQNGYRLILTGRRVERLVELKNRFESSYGSEVLLLPFDVRDAGAVEAALANLPQSFQDIDTLVNNAGLAKGLSPIHEGKLEHWETMIDTNVKGLLYVTRLVAPGMVQRKRGHIINVGSSAGKETYPNGNVYCATKFAVDALSKAMRLDLHAHNIRVSQVSPGHVEETEFAITRFDGDAERAKIYNDFQPLKSSDVADAIYYIATRPSHVNVQDLQLFATQQASSTIINRSGR